jgi:hypothetical protein
MYALQKSGSGRCNRPQTQSAVYAEKLAQTEQYFIDCDRADFDQFVDCFG